ncbi:MAG: OB-fold putative lipoprotein [Tannerella sp.]|jgi:hypothetical protein|nr:OB-fold putative lipoprotein [Tannerella sp.]
MNRKITYTAAMLILLLWVGGNANLPASTIVNETNEMNEINDIVAQDSIITAKELYDEFKKDEAAATQKYGNKTITIKGFAVFVGPDVYALPSVELSEKKGGKSRILCVLPFSDYLKLRKVSKGDEPIITGEVRGFYEKGDQVLLKQCEIKE